MVYEVIIPLGQAKLRWLQITATYLFIYHGDGRSKDSFPITVKDLKKWIETKKIIELYPIWTKSLKELENLLVELEKSEIKNADLQLKDLVNL